MQGKECSQAPNVNKKCQSFMDQNPCYYDLQPHFILKQEAIQKKQVPNPLTPTKGKGRPKGQKNGKNKERKTKYVLNQENRRTGHWSVQENKKYHWFLEIYNKHFICTQMRRLDKIFKTMAVFIGSRQAEQCRSHHQKMEKKYNSFSSILLYLRRFHYGTQDSTMVKQDIANNNVQGITTLISGKQLKDLQLVKQTSTILSLVEEQKVDGLIQQPARQFQFQQNLLDLLGEDYQYRFQFNHSLI